MAIFLLTSALLCAFTVIAERLIREDYRYQLVSIRDNHLLRALAILYCLLVSWRSAPDLAGSATRVALRLLAAAFITLPFFFLERRSHGEKLGPADRRYACTAALALPASAALIALLFACVWAALSEWRRRKAAPPGFAFLPYLVLSTLPLLFIDFWTHFAPSSLPFIKAVI